LRIARRLVQWEKRDALDRERMSVDPREGERRSARRDLDAARGPRRVMSPPLAVPAGRD
jgi:hypothetical protein